MLDLGTTGGTAIATARGTDAVFDVRLRDETAASAFASATAAQLAAVEGILGEPSDTGLAARLDALWNAWGALALDSAAGPRLLHAAGRVADALNTTAESLDGVVDAIEAGLADDVDALAATAARLAGLNRPDVPRAEQESLLLTMSALAGISVVGGGGVLSVVLEGQPLVTGQTAAPVSLAGRSLSVGGTSVAVSSGRIGAQRAALDRTLPAYRATLGAVARALAADTALFAGDGAAGLRMADVAPAGVDDTWSQGALRPGSADGTYAALVGNVAATSAEAVRRAQHREAVRGHLAELRSALTDVEPRAAAHAHQQAFNAASRVFTAVDGMLDVLLGHIGTADDRSHNRVTATGATAQSLAAVQSAAARLPSLQRQLATGRRITTSSDDPDGTVTAMALRSSLARNEHYAAACDDVLARLDEFEAMCEGAGSAVQRTRALVARALGAGPLDDAAVLVDDVRTTLAEIAARRPNPVTRTIAARTVIDLGAFDRDLFGDDATGINAQLRKIADLLRSAPESLSTSALDRLDAVIARIDTASNDAASGRERVQRLATVRVASDLALRTRLAEIEDVDLADVAVRTATANAAYQASLRTIAQADRPSLHDFLR